MKYLLTLAGVGSIMLVGLAFGDPPEPRDELPYYCVKGEIVLRMSDPARCAVRRLNDPAWELRR